MSVYVVPYCPVTFISLGIFNSICSSYPLLYVTYLSNYIDEIFFFIHIFYISSTEINCQYPIITFTVAYEMTGWTSHINHTLLIKLIGQT